MGHQGWAHGERFVTIRDQAAHTSVQRAAAEYLFSHFPGLEEKLSIDDYLVERAVEQDRLFKQVPPMRGAVELVQSLVSLSDSRWLKADSRKSGAGIPIALATGSSRRNFDLKTVRAAPLSRANCAQGHLPELFSHFHPTCVLTADSPEVAPGRGKPHPDIYLAAAQKLGRDVGTAEACSPEQAAERRRGLVFEDARPGVQAGVAAGMNGG